jgi:hypothetical protein
MGFFAQHKILVVLGGVGIACGVWYGLSPASTSTVLTTDGGEAGPGQDVVDTLRQLDAVKLDGGVLQNQSFLALKDFSTQIVPEPVGRPNPFAPLSGGPDGSASSTKAAQIFAPTGRK